MLTLEMVREAQEALRGIARRTPLDRAPKFGENVYIKAENLQLTGAFKLRGAYNKIRSLTPEEAEDVRSQIVTLSGESARSAWWRYPPRAFTEQGVAMLSAVLRGAKAVEVSIGIMDAFVEMSPFSSREDLAALLTA